MWARLLYQQLKSEGVDTFLDILELNEPGDFDVKLLNQIARRRNFLPVLTPGTLERCPDPGDWLSHELSYAVETDRNIVPLLADGFDFAEARRSLDRRVAEKLSRSNGVKLTTDYFDAAIQNLGSRRPFSRILIAVAVVAALLAGLTFALIADDDAGPTADRLDANESLRRGEHIESSDRQYRLELGAPTPESTPEPAPTPAPTPGPTPSTTGRPGGAGTGSQAPSSTSG